MSKEINTEVKGSQEEMSCRDVNRDRAGCRVFHRLVLGEGLK